MQIEFVLDVVNFQWFSILLKTYWYQQIDDGATQRKSSIHCPICPHDYLRDHTHAHMTHAPTTGKTPHAYSLWLLHWSTRPHDVRLIFLSSYKLIHNNFMVYVYLMVFLMWIDKKWTIMLQFFNNSVQV